MRADYKVLWWMPREHPFAHGVGAWSVAASRAYFDGGFDGVFYRFRSPVRHADLAFLRELTGLRYVEIDGVVRDDTVVFGLDVLEQAVLLTKCRKPIPALAPSRMQALGIDDRPGKEQLSALPHLTDLGLTLWAGRDLRFASGMAALRHLKIEGKRQVVSLDGIEECANLETLELIDCRVESLMPLRRLQGLRRLQLVGSPAIDMNVTLDLAEIAKLHQLAEVVITYAGSALSFGPLIGLPQLHEVRLRGTIPLDGDLSPLDQLRKGAIVVGPYD
jgi:hypothetical protein